MVLFTSSLPTALRFAMFSKCLKCNVLWVIPYSVKIVKYNLIYAKKKSSHDDSCGDANGQGSD